MTYGTVNADLMTTSDGVSSAGLYGLKNRIINGAMVIDQRNAGASVTPTSGQYTLDRWRTDLSASSKLTIQQNAGSVTPPAGYKNYLGVTSSSAYSVSTGDYFILGQSIEGLNCIDLAWGTASAATVTLSFWVRSSLTGTFGGSFRDSTGARSYPFTYTISSANTWEQKSITVAGDTTGTWLTTNGVGLIVYFGLGVGTTYSGTAGSWAGANYLSATGATSVVGTNGATFYITGVQLEKGSTATSFDYRPYTTELQLCQRYLPAFSSASSGATALTFGTATSTTNGKFSIPFPVSVRTPPTGITISSAAHFFEFQTGATISCTAITFNSSTYSSGAIDATVASGLTSAGSTMFGPQSTSALLYFTGCEL